MIDSLYVIVSTPKVGSAPSTNWLEWFKACVPLVVVGVGAWTGYAYGLRKTREERAFDRRLSWFENTVRALDATRSSIDRATSFEQIRAQLRESDPHFEGMHAAVTKDIDEAWANAQKRVRGLRGLLRRSTFYADRAAMEECFTLFGGLTEARGLLVPWHDLEGVGPVDDHPFADAAERLSRPRLALSEAFYSAEQVITLAARREMGTAAAARKKRSGASKGSTRRRALDLMDLMRGPIEVRGNEKNGPRADTAVQEA